jgi:stearoyl-CoA desaturase (delta-9 desaturase)
MNTIVLRNLITWIVVIVPSIGFFYGVLLLWEGQVGRLEIVLLAVMYVLTLFGVECGFHRYISHNAFKTSSFGRYILVVLGSMASQGPAIFWAATHRRHHVFSDEDGDPHSPRPLGPGISGSVKGFLHGHFGWLFDNQTTDIARYATDLIRDRVLFRLNQLYPLWVLLGLAIPAIVGGLYYGTWSGAFSGFLWGGLIRIFIVHHAVWSVNSFCHIFGDQPFKTGGTSKNNFLLALPTLGGAWHNNHHAFQQTANNSFKWWQIDLIGILLDILAMLGLVWDVKKITLEKTKVKEERV